MPIIQHADRLPLPAAPATVPVGDFIVWSSAIPRDKSIAIASNKSWLTQCAGREGEMGRIGERA